MSQAPPSEHDQLEWLLGKTMQLEAEIEELLEAVSALLNFGRETQGYSDAAMFLRGKISQR